MLVRYRVRTPAIALQIIFHSKERGGGGRACSGFYIKLRYCGNRRTVQAAPPYDIIILFFFKHVYLCGYCFLKLSSKCTWMCGKTINQCLVPVYVSLAVLEGECCCLWYWHVKPVWVDNVTAKYVSRAVYLRCYETSAFYSIILVDASGTQISSGSVTEFLGSPWLYFLDALVIC